MDIYVGAIGPRYNYKIRYFPLSHKAIRITKSDAPLCVGPFWTGGPDGVSAQKAKNLADKNGSILIR